MHGVLLHNESMHTLQTERLSAKEKMAGNGSKSH